MKDKRATQELTRLIEKAQSIHGHLGPFLVIGIRMSLAGMKKLGIKENNREFHVKAELPHQIPFTCILDGIQATTKCTFGNQKLILEEADAPKVSAKFYLKSREKQVIVRLKEEIVQYLEDELKKSVNVKTAQIRLAQEIASMPEEELLIIEG